MNTDNRIRQLLKRCQKSFDEEAAEERMEENGIDEEALEQRLDPPEPASEVATFDPKISIPLSPMLKARFDYAGTWKRGYEIWLSPSETARHMRNKTIRKSHRAMRENWEGSAPMIFPDRQLTLFGIIEGLPEDAIYLVWKTESKEPEVWRYVGYDANTFKNLEEYLMWCLERE